MNILFATNFAYLPQRTGGNESSTHDLCISLIKKNHNVSVISSLKSYDFIWFRNRLISKIYKSNIVKDKTLGYPVYRTYNVSHNILDVINYLKIDITIVQAGYPFELVNKLSMNKHHVVLYARDVEFHKNRENLIINKYTRFLANSNFTRNKLKEKYAVDATVIPPLINTQNYKVPLNGESVVHVGLSSEKGVEISYQLALKRPDIRFIFVESWPLSNNDFHKYQYKFQNLKNVMLLRRTPKMKQIYEKAKILLAPSVWEEAWGRVITEAQVSGIPVIASNRGGLPESVGFGGLIVSHDSGLEAWENALASVWDNPQVYRELSLAALQRSQANDINPKCIEDKFIRFLEQHIL